MKTNPIAGAGWSLGVLAILATAWLAVGQGAAPPERAAPNAVISQEDMADALREVIAAERAVYTRLIVQRLQNEEKVIKASENW